LQLKLVRGAFHDPFKLLIEICHVVKSGFKTDRSHTDIAFHQAFAGMTNPDLIHKMGEIFLCPVFKVAAETRITHIGYVGHFIERYLVFEIGHYIIKHLVQLVAVPEIEAAYFRARQ
jgi:hypothetical protein